MSWVGAVLVKFREEATSEYVCIACKLDNPDGGERDDKGRGKNIAIQRSAIKIAASCEHNSNAAGPEYGHLI